MGETVKIIVEGGIKPREDSMKIAFATKDMQNVNAHFGGAKEFLIYDVSKDGFSIYGVVKTDTSKLNGDDKTDYKVQALSGVNIMYCESIGGTAAAKVIRSGINPMKIKETQNIEKILQELVDMINDNPPPWIKRIMNIQTTEDPRLERWTAE